VPSGSSANVASSHQGKGRVEQGTGGGGVLPSEGFT